MVSASEVEDYPLRKVEESARQLVRAIIEEERRRNTHGGGDAQQLKIKRPGSLEGEVRRGVAWRGFFMDPWASKGLRFHAVMKQNFLRLTLAFLCLFFIFVQLGPLGTLEQGIIDLFSDVVVAERKRAELSSARKETIRPIDVAEKNLLSDIESSVASVVREERRRVGVGEEGGRVVRPMESSTLGPLGNIERDAVEILERVRREETERLEKLIEERPMNRNRKSIAGFSEAFLSGLLRFPILIGSVVARVKSLVEEEEGGRD